MHVGDKLTPLDSDQLKLNRETNDADTVHDDQESCPGPGSLPSQQEVKGDIVTTDHTRLNARYPKTATKLVHFIDIENLPSAKRRRISKPIDEAKLNLAKITMLERRVSEMTRDRWDKPEFLVMKDHEQLQRANALDARENELRERERKLEALVQEQASKSQAEHRENVQRLRQAQTDLQTSEATFTRLTSDNISTLAFSTSDLRAALASIQ
jgi:hypothetical protein